MAEFIWIPDAGLKCTTKPNLDSVQFGDGYKSVAPAGINHLSRSHNLTFTLLSVTTYQQIKDFLEARGAVEAFDWTPPGRSAGRYECLEWSDDADSVTYGLTMTFNQVYGR